MLRVRWINIISNGNPIQDCYWFYPNYIPTIIIKNFTLGKLQNQNCKIILTNFDEILDFTTWPHFVTTLANFFVWTYLEHWLHGYFNTILTGAVLDTSRSRKSLHFKLLFQNIRLISSDLKKVANETDVTFIPIWF